MLPDYHLHTWRCGHATGEAKEYVRAARAAGLKEIGFADHLPLYWLPEAQRDPGLAMGESSLPAYLDEIKALQKENPDLVIKVGIEADYIPGQEDKLARLLKRYPFDYVLGSVHYIDHWGFDHPEKKSVYSLWDVDVLYKSYFLLLQSAARSGLFDIIAHPDLIKKFGYRPKVDPFSLYLQTATVFAQKGVCIELNTAGLRADAAEVYPAPAFLKICCEFGIPVTGGSDAHSCAQVGYAWKYAHRCLKVAGYRQVAVFRKRSFELSGLDSGLD